jgi:phage protein D
MAGARRALSRVSFNGRDVSGHVLDFTYTDNSDKTDDVSVQLSDREERWASEWFPETGDMLNCTLEVYDWEGANDNREMPYGNFEIDNVDFSDTVTMNAVAVPITGNARSEKKTKAWKQFTLSGIAGDISGNAGLSLVYDTDIDPFYDQSDQNDKSDLDFLEELCKSDGLCMKVTDSKLIIFEEAKYDAEPAVFTVRRGSTDIIGSPKFKRNAKNIYTGCEINYFDSKTDKNYTGSFTAPNVGKVGHTLKLRENFNSESDDINLDRKAKARLREQNKNEWTCDVTVKGDIKYFAGINIEMVGWHKFDGKYHVTTCSHKNNRGGYTVSLSMRRCLEGY